MGEDLALSDPLFPRKYPLSDVKTTSVRPSSPASASARTVRLDLAVHDRERLGTLPGHASSARLSARVERRPVLQVLRLVGRSEGFQSAPGARLTTLLNLPRTSGGRAGVTNRWRFAVAPANHSWIVGLDRESVVGRGVRDVEEERPRASRERVG